MLLDNKQNGFIGEELKTHNFENSKLAVLSSLFTLYGFDALKEQLYFVVETKSTLLSVERRPEENGKIKCGHAHFAALGMM